MCWNAVFVDDVYGPWRTNWRPNPFEARASRYLWTDAFGVCAYLSLYHETKENRCGGLAILQPAACMKVSLKGGSSFHDSIALHGQK